MKRRISVMLVVVMLFATLASSTSKADASPHYGYSTYVRMGNRISDEWSSMSYNGKSVPYRVIRFKADASSSYLNVNNAYITKTKKDAKMAGNTALVSAVGDLVLGRLVDGSREIQQIGSSVVKLANFFTKTKSISDAYARTTTYTNPEVTASVAGTKEVVLVYIYWQGFYYLAYWGEKFTFDATLTAGYFDDVAKRNKLTTLTLKDNVAGRNNLNYNLTECAKNIIDRDHTITYKRVTNVSMNFLGTNRSFSVPSTYAFCALLGMQPFADGDCGSGWQ